MTPEEYERIKEAEKEHLRAIKKLKAKAREANRLGKVNRALQDMSDAPGQEILDTHDEMIDKLTESTIEQEVRLDMALSQEEPVDDGATAEAEAAAALEQADEELQKARASDLVRQMKIQMGLDASSGKLDTDQNVRKDTEATADDSEVDAEEAGEGSDGKKQSPESLPEKTIGRMPNKKSQ